MIDKLEVIELIDANQSHHEFLLSLFVSTRAVEVAAWGWSKHQALQFFTSQYDFQQRSYKQQFCSLKTYIIVQADFPIGVIQIDGQASSYLIVNFIVKPSMQGQGIGTSVLQFLQKNAEQQHKTIELSVENTNPAKQWYEHLGFVEVSNHELSTSMIWYPKHIEGNYFLKGRFEVLWISI